ncbi:MAG: DUF4287 domain-containing protein [Phycisphaerae bacterium]|nr:DUF4287 domain-containing protein [Phycisphaerae bacterium]
MAMVQKWIADLPAKTGRDLNEWMAFIRTEGPRTEKACRAWLKEEHGIGTNTAWWLTERAFGNAMGMAEDTPEGYLRLAPGYVAEQYSGARAELRPLYDRLLKLALSLGKDVRACPCKTIVPLYRRHVFAQLKPATNTRLDLGLCLAPLSESKIPKGRIVATGGREKKDRITHRIGIGAPDDIDDFVARWLRTAYERDAEA